MQIAIIGNTHNLPFLLGEGLRSLGVQVRMVVTRGDRLHHPVLAGLAPDGLPDWVFDASDLDSHAFEFQRRSIGPALDFVLHKADLVILNDQGPSLHNLLPLPAVSQLTDSDLFRSAQLAPTAIGTADRPDGHGQLLCGPMDVALWEAMVVRQRAGIRRSLLVSHPWRGMLPEADAVLDEIGVEDGRRLFLLFTDTERVRPTRPPPGRALQILGGARPSWDERTPSGLGHGDDHAADRLIRGFREFLDMGGEGRLILIETGPPTTKTRDLASALDLGDHVVWKTEMSAADLYRELEGCHVVCDHLDPSPPSMMALAGMAAGRPVIANLRLDSMARRFPQSWPACNAQSAHDVARRLWTLYRNPSRRDRLGAEARLFAETWLSPTFAAETLLARLAEEGLPSLEVRRLEAERVELMAEIRLLRKRAAFGAGPKGKPGVEAFAVLELDPSEMIGPDGRLWAIRVESAPGGDDDDDPYGSPAILLEDDVPLGPAHTIHEKIREHGGGPYSHWRAALYFSTSDGSSPKDNGRRYTLRFPVRP